MSKSKFTPEPWEWECIEKHPAGYVEIKQLRGGEWLICYPQLSSRDRNDGLGSSSRFMLRIENPADAALIAAAPDLYEALEKILKRAESSWRLEEHLKLADLYQLVEAALAKARGEK